MTTQADTWDYTHKNDYGYICRTVSRGGFKVTAYRDSSGAARAWFWFPWVGEEKRHVPDAPEHDSFCRGEMPAPVYADWLEENGVALPSACYDLLRGWTTEDE